MIRSILTRPSILALLAALLLACDLFAQTSVTQGNIVRSINIVPTPEGDYVLQIKGMFNPQVLGKIRVRQKANSTKFTLKLPQSLIDPAGVPGKMITFDDGQPLENVKISEGFASEGGFQLTLEVLSRKVMRTSIIEPITSSLLQVKLIDQAKAMAEANEGENMFSARALKSGGGQTGVMTAKRQKELEAQKQKALKQAAKNANEILKQYQKPIVMHISIVNGTGVMRKGVQLNVFLEKMQKRNLESTLGLKMDVVNTANAKKPNVKTTTIYYKENFLKAALLLASKIEGPQRVLPMLDQYERIGVDVEIYLGTDYK